MYMYTALPEPRVGHEKSRTAVLSVTTRPPRQLNVWIKVKLLSLVHTVPDFSPGVATVWTPGPTGTHRDHAVATPASTALNRDTPC